jgi:hypothetical protein
VVEDMAATILRAREPGGGGPAGQLVAGAWRARGDRRARRQAEDTTPPWSWARLLVSRSGCISWHGA